MLVRVRAMLARLCRSESLGKRGERAAARYLKQRGYRIVAYSDRNIFGELDLIAVDSQTIVFVEVKTRSSDAMGHPADAVDERKQARITRQAVSFLKHHHLLEYKARFDIVAIVWPNDSRQPTVTHYVNAFEPTGCNSFFS